MDGGGWRLAILVAAATLACGDESTADHPDGSHTMPDGSALPDEDGGASSDAAYVTSTGTCTPPEVIAIGAPVSGDLGAGADAQSGGCVLGSGGHDAVFQVTPELTGELRVVLSSPADLAIYARSSCDDEQSELDCGDAGYGGDDEAITIPTVAGTPIFLFIDAYSADEAGPFSLEMGYTDPAGACGAASPAAATTSGDNREGGADLIGSCGGDGPEVVYTYTTGGGAADTGLLDLTASASTGDLV